MKRIEVLVGALLVAIAAVVVARAGDGAEQLIHRAQPVFNILYLPDHLKPAATFGDEYLRVQGRTGRLRVQVFATPLRLPAYDGNVSGVLPIAAVAHERALRGRHPNLDLRDEGKARVNEAPGYQLDFRHGRTYGIDILLVPRDTGVREGLVLSLRQRRPRGALTASEAETSKAARKAFRSLRFGTERKE